MVGVRKSEHQSWLAKVLGSRLLCWKRDSIGRGQLSSNQVTGISTRTMHQSTTTSLSQTIWPRWASRQFLTIHIVQNLVRDFCLFPKLRGCRYEQLRIWKVIVMLTQEDLHVAFQKMLERYNKCIEAGGDYFEGD